MMRLLLAPILAVAAIAPLPAAAPVATATVTLISYRYNPGPIYLAGGVPVRMIFVNRSGKTHDFTAEQFFRSSQMLSGRAPGGEVSLAGGQSKVIDLIPARGTYQVHCGRFGHKMLGMSTMIIVG
ncbi:MAG: cupredoxin domain-containing protein [Sphingomicrobium sp.]